MRLLHPTAILQPSYRAWHDLRVPAKWWQPGHQDCDLEDALLLQIWHQLIGKLSIVFPLIAGGFIHVGEVQDFVHQQYVWLKFTILHLWSECSSDFGDDSFYRPSFTVRSCCFAQIPCAPGYIPLDGTRSKACLRLSFKPSYSFNWGI